MLDQSFKGFPGQIESVEIRVTALERGHDAQRLRIVIETAANGEAAIECALACMAEWRMTEIMRKRQRFAKILVETKRARQRTRNLAHFKRVSEPGTKMIALVKDEDLSLVGEPAKSGGVYDPVAIAAEYIARAADRFWVEAATTPGWIAGIGCARNRRLDGHDGIIQLTKGPAALN